MAPAPARNKPHKNGHILNVWRQAASAQEEHHEYMLFFDRGRRVVPRMPKWSNVPDNVLILLGRWEYMCQALQDPHFELTIEEFAPILATFRELQRAGIEFDRMLCALMNILQGQCFGRDDDSDSDGSDGSIAD